MRKQDEDKRAKDEIRERATQARAVAGAIEAAAAATAEKRKGGKKFNRHFKPSKRYRAGQKRRGERITPHPADEALRLVKELPAAKFDESMELHVRLGIDPKKSEQQVRGTFVFPHGIGKSKRVICFAEGPAADQAREAGAQEVGGEDLAQKILGGWFDFDVVIAHPAMMRHVGKLGKVLGPKKLMPNPKEGSVTPNVGQAVREFAGGKAKYRVDDGRNLHVVFGKRSFAAEKLNENLQAFMTHVKTLRPVGAKGNFIQGAYVCSTMSPGVAIDVSPYAVQ